MDESLNIPTDRAACQELSALLAEQARVIVARELTIKNHALTIQTQELTIRSLNDRLEAAQTENAEQKLTIEELLRRAFEKRSERYGWLKSSPLPARRTSRA